VIRFLFIWMLRGYRWVVSPAIHFIAGPSGGCRFEPTCSVYGIQAIERHGAVKGGLLTAKRLCRCHPWGGCGHDPVPEAAVPAGGRSSSFSPLHGS
jgi:uncharacterized protein